MVSYHDLVSVPPPLHGSCTHESQERVRDLTPPPLARAYTSRRVVGMVVQDSHGTGETVLPIDLLAVARHRVVDELAVVAWKGTAWWTPRLGPVMSH